MVLGLSYKQSFLALAYLRSRGEKPHEGDAYWTRFAVADAALFVFFGQLTS
jgi:hypothetical protein